MENEPHAKIYNRRDILKIGASILIGNISSSCDFNKTSSEPVKTFPTQTQSAFKSQPSPTFTHQPTQEEIVTTTSLSTTEATVVKPTSNPESASTPTPESSLSLTPTSLTPKLAAKYIVNGEYADLSSFEGRVFLEEKSGALVLLTQEVSERLGPLLASEGIRALSQSDWGTILEKRPMEYVLKQTEGTRGYILSLDMEGKPVVFFLTGDDKTIVTSHIDSRQVGNVGRKNTEGEIVFDPIPLYRYPDEIENPWEVVEKYDFRLHEETGEIIADDGFQISAYLRKDEEGTYEWNPILPHERRDGRAEFLTPEQKIDVIVKRLGDILGLKNPDGSVNPNSFITLPNSKSEPAIVLVKGGEGGSLCGLSPELGFVTDLQAAVARLNEIDPTIVDTITRGFGLKAVTYQDVKLDTFASGREGYAATYNWSTGVVYINQKATNRSPGRTESISTLLMESRGIAFDSNRINDKLADINGIDKSLWIKNWCETNKTRLSAEELATLEKDADYNIERYRAATQ